MMATSARGAMLMALGAFHGINPGMGWLFAVALGLQERRRGAVIAALVPLGLGHALAVAAAVAVAVFAGAVLPAGCAALDRRRGAAALRRAAIRSATGIRGGPACASGSGG